jgi:hypothetical protein
MRLHKASFALLVALLAVPVAAQETADSSLLDASGATAAASTSISTVSVSGTVTGGSETVSFSGDARIKNRLAKDPHFNSPHYVVTIDLSGVTGVGLSSRKKYSISGPEIIQKRVAEAHVIDMTFPFRQSDSTDLSARSGAASFALGFDVTTGAVTSASGSIATPNF